MLAREIERDLERLFNHLAGFDPLESHFQRQSLAIHADRHVDPANQCVAMIGHRGGQSDRDPRGGHLQFAVQPGHRQVVVPVGNGSNQVDGDSVAVQFLDLLDKAGAVLPVVLAKVRDHMQVLDAGGLLGQQLRCGIKSVREFNVTEGARQGLQACFQFSLETTIDALFEVIRLSDS